MIRLYRKRLETQLPSYVNWGDSVTHLHFLKIFAPLSPLKSYSFSSKTSLAPEKDRSFAVSYLTNSWGVSPEIALSLSRKVNLINPESSNKVLSFLRESSFTDTQISNLVKSFPRLLSINAEKTLLPKFAFFHSIGFSGTDLAQTVTKNPRLLTDSLENTIVPFYEILKNELVLDRDVVKFFGLSQSWHFSSKRTRSNLGPNIAFLRTLGVPNSNIVALIMGMGTSSGIIALSHDADKFKGNVEKVIAMGFDCSKRSFAKALEVVSLMSKSKWEDMVELYRQRGWTEDDFWFAFRRSPVIVGLSPKNVASKMDVLVNKMGWQPADVARVSNVLHYGLENWIVPRCSVIKVLLSKNLIMKKPPLSVVFVSPEERFLKRFVIQYQEQVPELLSIFNGKRVSVDLGFRI